MQKFCGATMIFSLIALMLNYATKDTNSILVNGFITIVLTILFTHCREEKNN